LLNSYHQHILLQSITDATRLDVRNSVSDEGFVYTKTHYSSRNRLYIPCRILTMTIPFDVIFGHRRY